MSTGNEKFNALVNNTSDVEEGEIPDQESLPSAANSKRSKENPKLKVLRSHSRSSSSGSIDSEQSNKGWWKKKKVKREGASASSHDFNSDDSDDEEIIEQPIIDQNYHRKGWNNKKDFRDKKHQHKSKQGYLQNKLPHKKEFVDSKFSRKHTQKDHSPQNDLYPCKYFIAYGKCDNPTCKNIHSPLVREQEIQRFVNENEKFFLDIFKRLSELNPSPFVAKVLIDKFGSASQSQPNTASSNIKPMPPPKNIGQPNVYLPPQGPQINNNLNTLQGQNLPLKPTQIPSQGNMPFNYPAPNMNPPPIHNPRYNPQTFAPGGPNIQQPNFHYNQGPRHPPQVFGPVAEFAPNNLPRINPNQNVNQYLPNMANKNQPYQPHYNQPQGPPTNFQGGFPNQRFPQGNYIVPSIEDNVPRTFNPTHLNPNIPSTNYLDGAILQNEDLSTKKSETTSPVKTGVQPAEETKTETQDQIAKFHEKMKNFGIFKTQEEPKISLDKPQQEETRELSKEELKSAAEAAVLSKFANGSINDQILKQIKGVLPQYQTQSPEDIKNLVNMYLKLSKDPRFSK